MLWGASSAQQFEKVDIASGARSSCLFVKSKNLQRSQILNNESRFVVETFDTLSPICRKFICELLSHT